MEHTKDDIRGTLMSVRASMPEIARSRASIAIQEEACALVEERAHTTVLTYVSYRSEVSTRALMRWVVLTGRTLLVPSMKDPDKRFAIVRLEDPAALEFPAGGPPEPSRAAPFDGLPDIVFCPGVAFDRAGRRLGYGKGHFDSYLATLPPAVLKVGLCFACQLVEELPEEDHDVRMDVVITEEGRVVPELPVK